MSASTCSGDEIFEYGPGFVIRMCACCGRAVGVGNRNDRVVAVGVGCVLTVFGVSVTAIEKVGIKFSGAGSVTRRVGTCTVGVPVGTIVGTITWVVGVNLAGFGPVRSSGIPFGWQAFARKNSVNTAICRKYRLFFVEIILRLYTVYPGQHPEPLQECCPDQFSNNNRGQSFNAGITSRAKVCMERSRAP